MKDDEIRVNSKFSKELLKRVDQYAKEHRLYRSHAISVLCAFALGVQKFEIKESDKNE